MASTATRHRLVTRSDFDGLVCAALLKRLGMLEDILFVHPKDMQDGKIDLRPTDITTNLPYQPGVHIAFDHHDSEVERVGESPDNHVIVAGADSAARVVYDHFGGREVFGGADIVLRHLGGYPGDVLLGCGGSLGGLGQLLVS